MSLSAIRQAMLSSICLPLHEPDTSLRDATLSSTELGRSLRAFLSVSQIAEILRFWIDEANKRTPPLILATIYKMS